MIIFLVSVIVMLIAAIIYLNVQFYREKHLFKIRLESLQQIIVESRAKQVRQSSQLIIADALDEKLKTNRSVLNNDLFGLNFELFDLLSKNNLLKK